MLFPFSTQNQLQKSTQGKVYLFFVAAVVIDVPNKKGNDVEASSNWVEFAITTSDVLQNHPISFVSLF